MIKKLVTDYLLALPGYLISLYLVSPVNGVSWWLWVSYLSVGYWLAAPYLLKVRPTVGVIRGMESYEPPYVKQLTDPDKRAPREPVTAPATIGTVVREVGGFGLLRVVLTRWGLFVIALPWLLGIVIHHVIKH
ncbi:hypothetical protein D1831_01335 [Lactiplantibacillus garii]|uniref:Uncharacterized protein n=1 Tax=Lactiplantibacillus garii TaxID=2306423 RepID=A0A426DB36_9LACO|nr:hypothetical protein [Lactiplantibacillus garii]RRK11743.1 hypothetical protein D1831_01335 [Lactiplantibacillus garii]